MKTMSAQQIGVFERLSKSGTSTSSWRDWKWQLRHAVTDIETFEHLLQIEFDRDQRLKLQRTIGKFPLSITPYYLSLIDIDNLDNDPIFRQSFPDPAELRIASEDMTDPLAEDRDSPVPSITHRYPDRVLFLVSNTCAMYCRHCTRKRRVGDENQGVAKQLIEQGLDYIRRTPQIRDVLLSGGDPLLLSNDRLDWILSELRDIDHVEIIRIGTRIYDESGAIRVIVRPVPFLTSERLRPGRDLFHILATTVNLVLRDKIDWDVEVVIAAGTTPTMRVSADNGAKLGQETWLGRHYQPERHVIHQGT